MRKHRIESECEKNLGFSFDFATKWLYNSIYYLITLISVYLLIKELG